MQWSSGYTRRKQRLTSRRLFTKSMLIFTRCSLRQTLPSGHTALRSRCVALRFTEARVQHGTCATWHACNMARVQHGTCHTQHATWHVCNMARATQHATWHVIDASVCAQWHSRGCARESDECRNRVWMVTHASSTVACGHACTLPSACWALRVAHSALLRAGGIARHGCIT
jgi:hypothetical protein